MISTVILVGILCYALLYMLLLCIVDCDVQLAFNEKFGKSIGRLKGKVVFITGASSGIGKYTALALAKHGVKLVLAARRIALLEQVKTLCLDVSQGSLEAKDIFLLKMDLLDVASHQKHFDAALTHFGQIDVLFNNAGRSQRALWDNIDIKVDKEVFDINVFSVVNLTRVALTYFATRGFGHVAVTSSLAGIIGVPFSASYTGAKHAINGYYNSLRMEKLNTKLNLAVTVICPGPTHTQFLKEAFTGIKGKKYGVMTNVTDRRMTAERCGHLCAVALANQSQEVWLCVFPLLFLIYGFVYYPFMFRCLLKIVGTTRVFALRDSKEVASSN